MHSFTVPSIAVAAIAALPAVSAHGYVSGIVAGGKWYVGSNPNWYYQPAGAKVDTAGWYAMNQDNGFVSPDAFATQVSTPQVQPR
jgi:cellulase